MANLKRLDALGLETLPVPLPIGNLRNAVESGGR